MSTKLRVYEVARDLGIDNKALVALLQSLGVSEVRNHMSAVAPDVVERLKRHQEKQSAQKVVEERIRPTVVKRRAVKKPGSEESARPAASAVPAPSVPTEQRAAQHPAAESLASAPPPVAAVKVATPPPEPPKAVPVSSEPSSQQVAAPPREEEKAKPDTDLPIVEAKVVEAKVVEAKVVEAKVVDAEAKVVEATTVSPAVEPATPVAAVRSEPASDAATAQVATAEPKAELVPSIEAKSSPSNANPAAALKAPAQPTEPEPAVAKSTAERVEAKPSTVPAAKEPTLAAVPQEQRNTAPERTASPSGAPARPSQAPATAKGQHTGPTPTTVGRSQQSVRPPHSSVRPQPSSAPSVRPAPSVAPRTSPPKTGIDVWQGRPGVPMPQPPRGPTPRRVQYDAKAGGGPGVGPRGRGGPGGRMGRGMRNRGIGSMSRPRGSGAPVTQERSAHKKVVKVEGSVGLQSLGNKMGIKAHELLRKLVMLGMTGVNINSTLDADTAKIVANEFGWEVEDVAVSEEDALVKAQGIEEAEDDGVREPRPPVVTVMGHVDHGKTSLLDRIRRANVVSGEAGGITQHIGAYSVKTPKGMITFLDTPGHAAFSQMRARGAQCTDIVILVVAADDGVMPQTKEAIVHAKNAKVPIVVAVNKVDKPDSQPERVRRELSDQGLIPEEWGGNTLFTEVSAATGQGVDELLEQVLLQAELLELRANPNKPASGIVIEAQLDRGKGPVATVLITDGTLRSGDIVLAGSAFGKMRAMLDHNGKRLAIASPSTPIAIIGLNDVPSAGDPFHALRDLKKAQDISDSRKTKDKDRRGMITSGGPRMTLEDLAKAMGQAEQLEFKLIIKADVQGSVEALSEALQQLTTEKVKVSVVQAGVGAITEGDVNLAAAAGSIIVGFNVRPAGKAAQLAQQESIEIRQYSIIYNVLEDVTAAMEGMLAPELVENAIGKAEVRQVFKLTKAGIVAGSMIVDGFVRRNAQARVFRDKELLWTGKIVGLKRFKEDVKEVKEGFDCGISLDGFNELREGDMLEVFEIKEVKQKL